jgi:hypothetical protein
MNFRDGATNMFRIVIVAFALVSLPALARDNGQWGNQPAALRQWFQNLMQPDNKYLSCCGEADAYEADSFEVKGDQYVAIITDGKGVIPNGTRVPVPNQKMKWDSGNPTGHGILFIGVEGQVYCYVTPSGV